MIFLKFNVIPNGSQDNGNRETYTGVRDIPSILNCGAAGVGRWNGGNIQYSLLSPHALCTLCAVLSSLLCAVGLWAHWCWEATWANWNQGIVMGCDRITGMNKACAAHLVQTAACPCLGAEVGGGAALPQQRLHGGYFRLP